MLKKYLYYVKLNVIKELMIETVQSFGIVYCLSYRNYQCWGSFIHKKTPCNSNFLVIKCLKHSFVQIIFLSLILSVIIIFLSLILSVIVCLDLVRKCFKKYLFC